MTREGLRRKHYSVFCEVQDIWNARTVKDIAEFDHVLDGFLSCTCWGRWTDFDGMNTRDAMFREWKGFLNGIIWSMYN